MIRSVRLQDFKVHRDTTVPLGRFTVLVGPNGAGKTSVLEALSGLAAMIWRVPDALDRAWSADIRNRADGQPMVVTVEGKTDDHTWQVSSDPRQFAGKVDDLDVNSPVGLALLQSVFGAAILYHLDAGRIAGGSSSDVTETRVSVNGANTAAVLASLKLGDDDRFARIEAELRKVVPQVERLRIRRVKNGEGIVEKIHFDFLGAPDLPAHVASEGTLVTLALLTVLCQPSRPDLVLLDDIHEALHPTAQIQLVRQIKRLLDETPDLQIVATTHSPYILDELDPGDVHVFALREDGTVAAKRLSEHPDAKKTKGALAAGQLWTLDRESDWVLDAQAP